jgi:hypothetical protein
MFKNFIKWTPMLGLLLMLSACGGGSSSSTTYVVSNVTLNDVPNYLTINANGYVSSIPGVYTYTYDTTGKLIRRDKPIDEPSNVDIYTHDDKNHIITEKRYTRTSDDQSLDEMTLDPVCPQKNYNITYNSDDTIQSIDVNFTEGCTTLTEHKAFTYDANGWMISFSSTTEGFAPYIATIQYIEESNGQLTVNLYEDGNLDPAVIAHYAPNNGDTYVNWAGNHNSDYVYYDSESIGFQIIDGYHLIDFTLYGRRDTLTYEFTWSAL